MAPLKNIQRSRMFDRSHLTNWQISPKVEFPKTQIMGPSISLNFYFELEKLGCSVRAVVRQSHSEFCDSCAQ